MPVLAVKAIKAARTVKYREVKVAVLWTRGVGELRVTPAGAARAEPRSHTVGWERVIVPFQYPLIRGAAKADEAPIDVLDKPAEARPSYAERAAVRADFAF